MSIELTLNVNGKDHTISLYDDQTPLLYVLRNQLSINSPKYGCGKGQCSSCMVLIDEKARQSCLISASSVQGKSVVTLEGLSDGKNLHPVQQSFIKHQAAQCGYCMNGMIITAVSFLSENAASDNAEIKKAMQPVLCRCGTHSRIENAVAEAANNMKG